MASFTTVDDVLTFRMGAKGAKAAIAISGTYAMVIVLEKEQGAPGSGAYVEIKRWSTANATVAYAHYSSEQDERIRLRLHTDTSGTATVTITDASDTILAEWKHPVTGEVAMRLTEEGLEVSGAIRRFASVEGGGETYQITASVSVDRENHAGKTGVFAVAGGATVTLPAATGTGDKYDFFVNTTLTTSGIIKVNATPGTDIIQGGVDVSTDAAGISVLAIPTADTITMNGTTTGGLKGSSIQLRDIAAGLWQVTGFLVSTGAEDTPFTATVP